MAPIYRKDDQKVKELFDDIEKLRAQFESIEGPQLAMEFPPAKAESPRAGKQQDGTSSAPVQSNEPLKMVTEEKPTSPAVKADHLDHEAELAKLESEFGKVSQDYPGEEIGDWEFDELEKEFTVGNSPTSK